MCIRDSKKSMNILFPMMREVSLETLPNVNIRYPSHDKNLPIMSVTGSINQNVFKSMNLVHFCDFSIIQDAFSRIFLIGYQTIALSLYFRSLETLSANPIK